MKDMLAALCLVAILEGLLLFAFPDAWRRMAEQLHAMDDRKLRRAGGILLAIGLVALFLVRG
ncbi:DUF2065 domain-containing protein [Luteimonas aquatica]|uniref:DUF2065 domain-containing protein n=1 Tax=Luteimonas aquatica TaxID=450364 RepID=UPI001F584F44|nr:DUF2065 family protein [Luteimonas aquatica]